MQLQQNNNIEEKLNGKHKVKITYDNRSYLLEILNDSKPILQYSCKKDILQNNSIKTNLITFIVDTKIIETRKEAREYINKIYSKLTPKLLDLKKTIDQAKRNANKITGLDEEERFVFNSDDIKKRLHSGIGIFENKVNDQNIKKYYFGFNIEKKVPLIAESGDIKGYINREKLVLIFDDHSKEEADKLTDDHNLEFTGDLIQEGYRWRLEEIKRYLDHQGMEKHYKVPTIKELFDKIKKNIRSIWSLIRMVSMICFLFGI